MSLSRSPNPFFFPEFGRKRHSLGLSSSQDALGTHPRPASLSKISTWVSSGLHSGAMSWTWALPTSPGCSWSRTLESGAGNRASESGEPIQTPPNWLGSCFNLSYKPNSLGFNL
ncbi:hypothetical protein L6452_25409 [Arctium lappa]|uniref:Uncharacterized protein n=1 Tax=Arctium lappa TaxID=4217 RepID=A0ACB9AAI5_ARCLA|nr:hypothetical protein L6452_25409 [Arctium lappa]